MATRDNPAPGFVRKPDYRMATEPAEVHVQVLFNATVVADTTRAVALSEADYPVVYYIPISDIRMEFAESSDHQTHCPFKGDASYWHLVVDGKREANAFWCYEAPFDEAEMIRDHVAFYPSRVDSITISPVSSTAPSG